jgi:hypothetical protein
MMRPLGHQCQRDIQSKRSSAGRFDVAHLVSGRQGYDGPAELTFDLRQHFPAPLLVGGFSCQSFSEFCRCHVSPSYVMCPVGPQSPVCVDLFLTLYETKREHFNSFLNQIKPAQSG